METLNGKRRDANKKKERCQVDKEEENAVYLLLKCIETKRWIEKFFR